MRLERCQALGGSDLHLRLLETISLIDLFKERSGLVPNVDLLTCVFSQLDSQVITSALDQLQAVVADHLPQVQRVVQHIRGQRLRY